MKLNKTLVFVVVLTALLLQGCGASAEAVATALAETLQISQLQTAAAGGGQAEAAATDTPSPGLAFVSVSQNTNCRSGPGTSFSILTTINVGQQVEVLKAFSSEYVLVRNPNGTGDCWLFLRYADTTDFTAFNLEVATSPPTPELANDPISTQNQEDAQGDEAEDVEISVQVHAKEVNFSQPGDTCPVEFKWEGLITVNGPMAITYRWNNLDGSPASPEGTLTVTESGTYIVTLTQVFTQPIGDPAGTEYTHGVQLNVLSPESSSGSDDITFSCD